MKTLRVPSLFTQVVTGIQIALVLMPMSVPQLWAQSSVTRITINQGTGNRSTLTNVAVAFSTNVTLTPPAMRVFNLTTASNLPATNIALSYDPAQREATWTFPGLPGGSLPDGIWLMSLLPPAIKDPGGVPLAGSLSGLPGDPRSFPTHRYFGDVNRDKDVDFADTYWFKKTWLLSSNQAGFDPRFDFNGDGRVNTNDLTAFNSHYFTILKNVPGIFAMLVNDTGESWQDGITSDATIAGNLFRTNASARLTARLAPAASFTDVTTNLLADDSFRFTSNRLIQINGAPLREGSNTLDLRIVETNGLVSASFSLPFVLAAPCAIPNSNGWNLRIAGAGAGQPGSVVFANCGLTLTEGDSFLVAAQKDLIVPAVPGLLAVDYAVPTFDGTATNLMRDAFEVALLDVNGKPLTFTIQGAAGVTPASAAAPAVLPASPDACLNHSDSHTPFFAPGTALSILNPPSSTLAVDLSPLAPGTPIRLVIRLINNDRDRATTVRITDVKFRPIAPGQTFPGSSGTALSLLSTSSSGQAAGRTALQSLPPAATISLQPRATANVSLLRQPKDGPYQFPIATNITVNSNYLAEVFTSIPGVYALAYPPVGSRYAPNLYASAEQYPSPGGCDISRVYRIAPDGTAAFLGNLPGTPAGRTNVVTMPGGSPTFIGEFPRQASPWFLEFPPLGSAFGDNLFIADFILDGTPCDGLHGGGTIVRMEPTGVWTNFTAIGRFTGGPANPMGMAFGYGSGFGDRLIFANSSGRGQAPVSEIGLDGTVLPFLPASYTAWAACIIGKGAWHDQLLYGNSLEIRSVRPDLTSSIVRTGIYYAMSLSANAYFGTNIYLTTFTNTTMWIQRMAPDGREEVFATVRGTAANGNGYADNLEFTPDGKTLFVSDHVNNRIYRITPKFEPADLFLSLNSTPTNAPAGSVISISGLAGYTGGTLGRGTIASVMVNDTPADALDPAGDFFATVTLKPGRNDFVVVAEDSLGATVSSELTITGTQPDAATDFSQLGVVSASVRGVYGRTSFNEKTRNLYADVALRNVGSYAIRPPFYVGVTRISDPSVSLLAADGVTPDGLPYYDFTATLTNGVLNPQQTTLSRTLAFSNPNQVQFAYELVVLGQLNQAPYFTTAPPLEVLAGRAYAYDANAADPDGDALRYSLVESPEGMTIAPNTGLISWGATNGVGSYNVRLGADDGRGGIAEQRYVLSVIPQSSNRPPYFVSRPVTVARVGANDSSGTTGTNLLLNGSFEYGPAGHQCLQLFPGSEVISNWSVVGIDIHFVRDMYWTGSDGGASVDLDGADNGGVEQAFQTIPGHTYLLRFKLAGNAWSPPQIKTMVVSAAGQQTGFAYDVGDQNSSTYNLRWESREWSFNAVSNSTTLRLYSTTQPGSFGPVIDEVAVFDVTLLDGSGNYSYDTDARDPDGDTLTYSLIVAPTNMTINPVTGLIRWVPVVSQIGQHNVTVQVVDGQGGTNWQSYLVCVMPAEGNRPPIIVTSPAESAVQGATYYYDADALDPDADAVTYSLRQAPPGMTINLTNGLLSWDTSQASSNGFAPGLQTFFGEDVNFIQDPNPGIDNPPRLTVRPNSETARLAFLARLQGVRVEDFESFAHATTPATLTFGSDSATLSGSPTVRTVLERTMNGAFPTSGTNLLFHFGPAGSFEITFSSPQAAFGFYATDLGDGGAQLNLTLHRADSTTTNIVVPHTAGTFPVISGSAIYFGVVDTAKPFTKVTFTNTRSAADGFGFDDMTIGRVEQVLAPSAVVVVQAADGRGGVDEQAFNITFALPGTSRVAGLVFNDANGNGVADVSPPEPGLTNWVVYLDLNGNQRRDTGERMVMTDSNGRYALASLPAGNYSVRVEPPPGWRLTVPATDSYQFTLTNGQVITNADFGVFQVTNTLANSNPYFVGTPPTNRVAANQVLLYPAFAADPDGDALRFDFVVHPDGMMIETNTGVVAWRPTLRQLGLHDVILRVQDGRGGVALQSFQIDVIAPNSAPFITTFPPNPAIVDLPYRYVVRAQDAEKQALTFSLGTNVPAGMALAQVATNFNAAVLDWTPALTSIGTNRVEIVVRDSEGAEARQTFNLEVVASAANRPPAFTTSPRVQARIGFPWAYAAQASDPDGDPLSFQLVSAPAGTILTNAQPSTPDSAALVWTPTNLGFVSVSLAVDDGRAGGSVTQTFAIVVSSTLSNSAPVIVSSPVLAGTGGQPYQYDLAAEDADGDQLAWSLATGPVGMSLDPNTGALRWIPTGDQLGTNTVTVQVQDTFAASATQTFQVVVGCVNGSPQISSVPPVMANVGQPYLYAPRATDPDGDKLTWSLLAPVTSGMTINSTNGLIRWTPTTNQVGAQLVQVRVSDNRGGADTQQYTLYAVNDRANHTPVIVTSPLRGATVGRSYTYDFRATDSDSDPLTLQALVLPAGAVVNNVTSTGGQLDAQVVWTPTAGQLGPNDFILVAKDPSLASTAQRFSVLVRSNLAPVITSDPPTNAVPGVTYRYDVAAYDADGDPLTYTLSGTIPPGLTMDNLGRIAWTPTLAQVGSRTLTVTVADMFGATAAQTFPISVVADTEPPVVSLWLTLGLIDAGGGWAARVNTPVQLLVRARDNVAVTSLALQMGSQNLPLDSRGVANFSPGAGGLFTLLATATDAAGNVGTVTNRLRVINPAAVGGLTIQIQSPTNDATVTLPTPVIVTITNTLALASYAVDIAPAGEVDLSNLAASSPAYTLLTNVTVAAGITNLINAVLAKFDPTVLVNDTYLVRVSATDISGNSTYEGVLVSVQGDLKFGEFKLEFTDLSVPVAGIPITVTRVYDSRLSRRVGDFGYGWSLGLQDARILIASPDGTLHQGTRVYLTGPDGRRLGFTTEIQVTGGTFFIAYTRFVLKPDPGIYERLDADGLDDIYFGHTSLNDAFGEQPRLQTVRLTTKDGLVYEYDRDRGLQRVTDLNGNRLTFTPQGIQHVLAGSGAVDQQVTFQRDAQGRIQRIIDTAGNPLTYTYDGAGDLRAFTDQATNETQYAYSTRRAHYLETIIDPLGHQAIRSIYDDAGKLVAIVDALGHTNRQDFDADALFGTFTDANGHATTNYFDAQGNTVKTIDPMGGTTEFRFDANNHERWRKDPRGFITERGYDSRGNLTNLVDAASNVTAIAYSDLNKPLSVTDAQGHPTQFRYNERGELTNVVNALGGQAFFTRDAQGRVGSVTDFNGHTTIYDYQGGCSCGKPGKVINPDGTLRTYEYNSLGQATREVNELNQETVSDYDGAGRLRWTRDAETNYTHYLYRGALKVAEIDPLNRTNWFGYDDANRLVVQTNAMGGVVRFTYDNGTNRTSVTDPVGNVTRFYYDAANRLSHQVDPWNRTNFFTYDAAGNRTEAVDRNGHKRTFGYDAMNRRTNELWWEGTNVVRTIGFTFSALGVMTGASDLASRLAFGFDALSRLETATQSGVAGMPDFTLTYGYDGMTNVVSVADNWGVQVASAYNTRNQLVQRVWQGGGIPGASLRFDYDAAGNRTNVLRYSDVAGSQLAGQTRFGFSPVGLITDILHASGAGATLAEYHYQRNAAQEIFRRTLNGQTADYDYDSTSQLTNALYSAGQPNEGYHYDANGNRIGGGYVVTTNNQIVADSTNTYSYDLEGSLVGRSNTVTLATTTYRYDHRNRLVSVLDKDAGGTITQTVEFTYDVLNRRIAKSVNGAVTRFLLNQDNIWADASGAGAITARYLLGNRVDEMLARYRPGEAVVWYLTDNLGTVRDLADSTGAVVNHTSYDSFGKILSQLAPAVGDRFLFTGRELDLETGLVFYRARYYSPDLGRFVTSDPIGFSGDDYNLYRYVLNSPVQMTDPFGEDGIGYAVLFYGGLGAAIGALISATTSYSCPGVGTFTNVVIGGLTGFIAGQLVLVAIIISFVGTPAASAWFSIATLPISLGTAALLCELARGGPD